MTMDNSAKINECLHHLSLVKSLLASMDEKFMPALESIESVSDLLGSMKESNEEQNPEAANPVLSGKDTLLLVEDDTALLSELAMELSVDYNVLTAVNGAKGLSLAREKSPDIIVSDIGMPEMDGLEMCRLLKSSPDSSHIPVILLTGKQDKQTILHGFEAGASDYIVKPCDLAVLTARIRNILSERQRMRKMILSTSVALPPSLSFSNRLDKEFMNKVLKVVEKEMANADFQVDGFCRQMAMSRTAFYNKLKALTGMSPNDFVRMVRLNKAKELLSSKIYNVAEVSEMVGFSDPKYFSICFKKQFDTSPSKI